ncbi:MAG: hypothetical protein AB7Q42_04080 [Acidimicrobiia bacterium]
MSGWPSERARDGGIDEIPLPGVNGRLWLCGKHVVGPDPETALERVAGTTIVCLNERHELAHRYPRYVDWLTINAGGRALWFPIPDLHAPTPIATRVFLDELRRRLTLGERVVMHCGAGIGRAGTMAACLLVGMQLDSETALRRVADHRPMAGPEAGVQRALVDAFALMVMDAE